MRNMVISIAPVLLAMSSGALAAPAEWKISEVSGDVRLRENGRVRPAFRGALLASGATIATGPAARAVIVRGEEFIVISPRTQLRLPEAAKSDGIMQIIEDFGTAIFKIQKKSTPHFGVQTPYLAAVVKGTTFTVTAGADGASVQVTEGAVQVSTLDGGAAELVGAGAIATVGADDLSQLSIAGETNKVIRSENSAAPATAVGKSAPAAQSARYAGPPGQEIRIVRAVSENPKSLGEVTKGLVEGHSASDMAVAEFREQARLARREGSNPGKGDGNDDKGKPGEGKDKPTEGKNKPVNEKDKPAEGTDKPGGKDAPDKGSDKPSDGSKDKPGDGGKDKPGDGGKDKPGDGGKEKPGDGGKEKPGDHGKERPDKDHSDKSDDNGKPDGDKGKSGGDSGSKDQGGEER